MPRTMILDDLTDGCSVTGRTGRCGANGINWDALAVHKLHVQRNARGEIVCVALHDQVFAEFDPRHHLESGDAPGEAPLLMSEDYCFEIHAIALSPSKRPRP